jgi:hypothetical protein
VSSVTSVVQEAAGQIVTGTAVDNAGNSTNVSVTANLDKTMPSLALAPSNGATLTNAQPVFLAQYSDSLSDLSVSSRKPVTNPWEELGASAGLK